VRGRRGAACAAVIGCLALAPAAQASVVTTRNLEIEMSDGVRLRADLYRPAVDRPLPTVVIKFAYNKDDRARSERRSIDQLARAGFAGLVVDSRGTGASEGAYCFLCRRDHLDGREVVEWAARQPFSDGNVGMWGYSEPGVEAALTATTRPPHLKAIVPAAAYNDPYRDITYPGGMRASEDGAALGVLFGAVVPNKRVNSETDPALAPSLVAERLAHPGSPALAGAVRATYDAWWAERSYGDRAHRVDVPALHVSGWHDVYPRGATLNFLAHPKRDALLMGPWGHLGATGGPAGDLIMAASIAWFDIHLRTRSARERARKLRRFPRVLLFDQDAAAPPYAERRAWRGAWRRFGTWPPRHRERRWRLCPAPATGRASPWPVQGGLGPRCGETGAVPVAALPLEPGGGTSLGHDGGALGSFDDSAAHDPLDQRLNAAATAFVGAPLRRPVTLTGPMTLRLTARTAGTDADWIARVVDVGPDRSTEIARGWLKASHRAEDRSRRVLWHTHRDPQRLQPGVPYRIGIEIWPSSYRVPAGHRLAVLLNAADTRKASPGGESAASEVLIGPDAATLTLPERTDPGARVADPAAAYAAASS
jgi:uncharacterized protein